MHILLEILITRLDQILPERTRAHFLAANKLELSWSSDLNVELYKDQICRAIEDVFNAATPNYMSLLYERNCIIIQLTTALF